MSGPPKVNGKKKYIEFPDPDDYESMLSLQKGIRRKILDLRQVIGNDSMLEARLIDCLRFIGHTPLNKQVAEDELMARTMNARTMNSRGSNYADCLFYLVLQSVNAWHNYADPHKEGGKKELQEYLGKLDKVREAGMRTFPICGDEVKGFWIGV